MSTETYDFNFIPLDIAQEFVASSIDLTVEKTVYVATTRSRNGRTAWCYTTASDDPCVIGIVDRLSCYLTKKDAVAALDDARSEIADTIHQNDFWTLVNIYGLTPALTEMAEATQQRINERY